MRKIGNLIALISLMLIVSACGSSAAQYNNQGNNYFAEAAYDDALGEYSAAKEANPELAEPYYNSGNALQNKGDLKAAVDQTQPALRMTGNNDELAEKAFYNLGNSYFLAEDWPAAIKAYQEALLLKSNDSDAKYNLELALRNLQQQQQQQQQQGNGGQPQPNPGDQPGGQGQQPQGEGDQQQPGGGGQPKDQQDGSGGKENGDQPGTGEGELSKQEAEQLLDNLSQNGQTLQERLNKTFDGQGQSRRRPPEQDW